MANRYWVGGTGTWNTSSTTNWSASSGGASGASVPTAADSVFFDQAGTYTVTMTGALTCLDLTVSAGTVTFAVGTAPSLSIYGNFSISSATVWALTGRTIFFSATTSTTVTTNGVTLTCGFLVFNGSGGTWVLQDALTVSGAILHSFGTLNANNKDVSCQYYSSNYSNIRTLTMGSGTWTVTGTAAGQPVWDTSTTTNLTFNKDTANIVASGSTTSTRLFNGGGLTFNKLTIGGVGIGGFNFSGSNTFSELASTKTTAHTIRFTAGTTTTLTSGFTVSGTAGNVVTIGSTTTSQATLRKPGAWYVGANSTDGGNNSGLVFSAGGGIDYLSISYINGVNTTGSNNLLFGSNF